MLKQNYPNGYHISKGADDIYWILNEGEEYKGKLSTDLNKAKAKAEEKIGYVPDVVIWHRRSWEKFTYIAPLKQHEDHISTYKFYIEQIEFNKYKKSIEDKYSKFSHIGNVGDRLNLELTITEIFTYPIQIEFFPYTITGYGHKFVDQNNNKLIYFGASKEFIEKYTDEDDFKKEKEIYKVGDKITVKATIKEHTTDIKDVDSETQIGMPLTIIARPKINKPKLIKERENA
tara:strand:- start:38 stop:730 length:693 start_codon:yes stop_codon:yes gene_type:complete